MKQNHSFLFDKIFYYLNFFFKTQIDKDKVDKFVNRFSQCYGGKGGKQKESSVNPNTSPQEILKLLDDLRKLRSKEKKEREDIDFLLTKDIIKDLPTYSSTNFVLSKSFVSQMDLNTDRKDFNTDSQQVEIPTLKMVY